jgi:predicted nucleic acid-binding protein
MCIRPISWSVRRSCGPRRRRAFEVADRLGCDTAEAEYVAIARGQADALVTLDDGLARRAAAEVEVAPVGALARP